MIYCPAGLFIFIVFVKDLARRQRMFSPFYVGAAIGRGTVICKLSESFYFLPAENQPAEVYSVTDHDAQLTPMFRSLIFLDFFLF